MHRLNGRRPERLTAVVVIVVAVALVMAGDLVASAGPNEMLKRAPTASSSVSFTSRAQAGPKARVRVTRAAKIVPTTEPSTTLVRAAGSSNAAASNASSFDSTTLDPALLEPAATPGVGRANLSSAPAPMNPTPASRSMYWGASIGSQLTGDQAPWDMSAVTKFESIAGKRMSILNWGDMFYSPQYCSGYCYFDPKLFDGVRNHGSIPFVTWASAPATGAFTDARIAAGAQDVYLRKWATAAKNWGHPFFLRFDWEMNGSWFGWGVGANGNSAADYVAMWRHVHDIFQSVGATNVSWVWCPNVDLDHLAPLASLYPGGAYIDWVGLDGYNWGTNPAGHNGGWETFDRVYRSTYDTIVNTIAPGKPIIVSEVGSTEHGGSKAAWITDMLTVQLLQNYPEIDGVLWFDRGGAEADNMDWPIESSAAATSAFASGIQNRIYTANSYASLGGSKVFPP